MDAEGPDYRRHTVLQRSRTSEAVGTSAISDHRSFTSSFIRIIHSDVVVKKNFVNLKDLTQRRKGTPKNAKIKTKDS
jgi:hypothetical protein